MGERAGFRRAQVVVVVVVVVADAVVVVVVVVDACFSGSVAIPSPIRILTTTLLLGFPSGVALVAAAE